jgi:small-conductance mechanosensitive channel
MSEPFTFDVNYSTTFDQLEHLRHKMIAFLQNERRDFQPSFDVSVVGVHPSGTLALNLEHDLWLDFPDQGKMSLKADIKYKSNWQHGALKCKPSSRTTSNAC